MSVHDLKSKRRHPNTERVVFPVDHVNFEVCPKNRTYGLVPGLAETAKEGRALFTGFYGRAMVAQMRAAADGFEALLDEAEREVSK